MDDVGPKVVAVTGIAGLIGRELALQLDADDEIEKVVGIDVADFDAPSSKFVFVKRSVTEPFGDLLAEHKVEAAIHLAFLLNPVRDRATEERVNVGGSKSFLDSCAHAKVKSVLVVSSATAYGALPDNPPVLYEGAPLRAKPDLPYAHDKARVEELCYDFAKANPDVSLAIVRPCIVIGPHASNFMTRMLDQPLLFGPWGQDPPMQFVHEDDVVRAIHRIVKQGKVGVFNIAADGALTLGRVAELARRRTIRLPVFLLKALTWLGWHFGWKWLSEAPPGFVDFCRYPWCVSNVKLKTEVGFLFKYDALRAMVDYLETREQRIAGRVRVEVDADDLDELEAIDRDLEGGSEEDLSSGSSEALTDATPRPDDGVEDRGGAPEKPPEVSDAAVAEPKEDGARSQDAK